MAVDATNAEIAELVHRYQQPLLAYATRLGGDATLAQDAVQETFLRLCRDRTSSAQVPSDTPTSVASSRESDATTATDHWAAWLFSVCRCRVIDMKRKHNPDSIDAIDSAVIDAAPPPGASLEAAEDQQHLADSIDQLSPRQREVLQLRLHAGLSYREIADVTGLSESNVGFHLHQAIKSLRTRLVPG